MDVLKIYRRLEAKPGGKWLFSRAVAAKAPYFRSIAPQIVDLSPERAVARVRNRRAVQNHLGTVHAIAMCNLAEFTAGLVTEAACPPEARWIPKSMQVDYLAKAETDLQGTARFPAGHDWSSAQGVPVPVEVLDTRGQIVFRAEIQMYCSPKARQKAA